MADNDEFDNENDTQNNNSGGSGKGLRAQLESALAEVATLKQENGELKAAKRSGDLASLLKSAGAKAGAEKFYPADADVSKEAVEKWVEDNAAFVRDESAGDSSDDSTDNGIPDQTRANAQRLAALADSNSQRPAGDISNLIEQMKAAKTPEELSAIYAQVGLKRE